MFRSKIAVTLMECRAEFIESLHVTLGQEPAPVRRDPEHELAAPPDRVLVNRNQIRHTLETCLVIGMPEPVVLA